MVCGLVSNYENAEAGGRASPSHICAPVNPWEAGSRAAPTGRSEAGRGSSEGHRAGRRHSRVPRWPRSPRRACHTGPPRLPPPPSPSWAACGQPRSDSSHRAASRRGLVIPKSRVGAGGVASSPLHLSLGQESLRPVPHDLGSRLQAPNSMPRVTEGAGGCCSPGRCTGSARTFARTGAHTPPQGPPKTTDIGRPSTEAPVRPDRKVL